MLRYPIVKSPSGPAITNNAPAWHGSCSLDGKILVGYPTVTGSLTLDGITSIGREAFTGCTGLSTLNFPAVASIGMWAFADTGTQALAVILGSTPPSVEEALFWAFDFAKTVAVKVPSGATDYGTLPGTYTGADATENWGNAFRSKGWNGTNYLDGTVNSNIGLTIQAQ
jgi:hypothetical protein